MSNSVEQSSNRHPSNLGTSGVQFAHPSEATLASLLNLYLIRWVYEPVEFPLDWHKDGSVKSAFRPDFYLPDHGGFLELTCADQRTITRKTAKIRRFHHLYPEIPVTLLRPRDFYALCQRHGILGTTETAA